MTDTATVDSSDSRYALYEGLIALAWTDHDLHENEQAAIIDLIERNRDLSDTQRATLKADIATRKRLDEVWPRITDAQDRARLIDFANIIFAQDGEYCDAERETAATALRQHLASINAEAIHEDLAVYRQTQIVRNKAYALEMQAYRQRFSLIEALRSSFQRN